MSSIALVLMNLVCDQRPLVVLGCVTDRLRPRPSPDSGTACTQVSRDDLAAMSDYYSGEDGAEVRGWRRPPSSCSPSPPQEPVTATAAPAQTRAKCWLFISYLIAFGAVAGR